MDLITQAESLLLYQFSQSPKLIGLVKSIAQPFQEILVEIEKLHHGRYISQACGQSLDIIGDIVNCKRHSMSDEDYRVWLKVAILLNHSQGTANGVLAILIVLFGLKPKIQLDEYEPNVVIFTFFSYPHVATKILFAIIRHALPITTRCKFVDASSGPSSADATLSLRAHTMPVFQLDVTSFDESVFADFFREKINEQE